MATRSDRAVDVTTAASVVGVGAWAPGLASWSAWPPRLDDGAKRPVAALLPPAERRRAPDGVSVALAVAQEAVVAAGVDPVALPSVFASAYGDLAIVDYLCATLAADPLALSPTRFHHSVHNAAAGYWGIATGDAAAATAVAAGEATFAAGLVEALVQCAVREGPVLFVAFDTPAAGLLASAARNTALFGCALVLAPLEMRGPRLSVAIEPRTSVATMPADPALHALANSSASAQGVALLEALASDRARDLDFPLGPASTLRVTTAGMTAGTAGPCGRVG